MISQGEVMRRYAKLEKDIATDPFYKIDLTDRINCYSCGCGHITKTKDIDAGVTPMVFYCENCGSDAKSTFYQDIAPAQKPTIEWYRPALQKVLKMRNKPALLDHILNGGLVERKITVPL